MAVVSMVVSFVWAISYNCRVCVYLLQKKDGLPVYMKGRYGISMTR